jgi:exopolysaccharide biosynthesis operon protein EpsL
MLSIRYRPLAVVIGALFTFPLSMPAFAQAEEGMRLYGGIGWAYDDNLLRVPENERPFGNKRGDSYRTLEGGIVYNKRISRQRVAVSAKASKVKFDYFKQLDYDGRDVQGVWNWELGRLFEGRAEASYARVLAPYTDFRSDQRNLRQQQHRLVDAGIKMHPSWKLRFGVARDEFTYELLAQRFNNRTEKAAEVELMYTPKSGSSVGLVARRLEGDYPFRRPGRLDNTLADDFTQDELKARVNWIATGSTTLQALVGYVRREQPSFGEGKTSGVNGRVNLLYTPKGKVSYTASVWREFAPIESTAISYTLNKGAKIAANWYATGKVRVDAEAVYEQREYNARRAFVGSDDLNDSIRAANLRATWQATRKIQVITGYSHQQRSGAPALGTSKFDANVVQVSANVLF